MEGGTDAHSVLDSSDRDVYCIWNYSVSSPLEE